MATPAITCGRWVHFLMNLPERETLRLIIENVRDMNFGTSDLTNKTVLEVGSGRGETTRELASQMAGKGGRLIVTDISDEHFEELRSELASIDLPVDFIRTSGLKLAGVRPASVDLVVCNYTLCAINAIVGQGELALRKFSEVLKPGGGLYLEEELPQYMAANPAQNVWAEKWQLIKAAQVISGARPFNEYQPDVLESLTEACGFEEIEVSDEVSTWPVLGWMDFFRSRFDHLLKGIGNKTMVGALKDAADQFSIKAQQVGYMETPYIILIAKKPWRIE